MYIWLGGGNIAVSYSWYCPSRGGAPLIAAVEYSIPLVQPNTVAKCDFCNRVHFVCPIRNTGSGRLPNNGSEDGVQGFGQAILRHPPLRAARRPVRNGKPGPWSFAGPFVRMAGRRRPIMPAARNSIQLSQSSPPTPPVPGCRCFRRDPRWDDYLWRGQVLCVRTYTPGLRPTSSPQRGASATHSVGRRSPLR